LRDEIRTNAERLAEENGLEIEFLHKKKFRKEERIKQVEYATDIIFKRKSDLKPIYDQIVRTAIHSVKPENIVTFLGRKLNGNYTDEMGNDFHTRVEGTCIRHHMGKVAIIRGEFNISGFY
jgi:hypothetical protein